MPSHSLCLLIGYYIASGAIVGSMVFAAVVLAIIIICCCYVCKAGSDDAPTILPTDEVHLTIVMDLLLKSCTGINYWNTQKEFEPRVIHH